MMSMRYDISGFRRKMAALEKQRKLGRVAAVKLMGGEIVGTVLRDAPRDTQRYVAGWAQAGNAAQCGPFAVPSVRASRRAGKNLERLVQQANAVENRMKAWYGGTQVATKRKPDKWFWRLQKALVRAQEQIAKFTPEAIVIYGRGMKNSTREAMSGAFGGAVANAAVVRDTAQLSRQARALPKVYGGTGKFTDIGDASFVTFHNMEPHASIVERRNRAMVRALAAMKGVGLKRLSPKYIAAVTGFERRRPGA